LLVIATWRPDEVTDQHPLASLLPVLVREAHATRLTVPPFSTDDVDAYVAQTFPLTEADRRRLVAYLVGRGEGNPFFVSEWLHTLEATGMLRRTGKAWMLRDLRDVKVPALIRQVIRDRLSRLDGAAEHLLAIAALIGHEAPFALWQVVSAADEETLITVI